MIRTIYLIFGYLIMLSITESHAQTVHSLDELEKKYRACLDKGLKMSNCSKRYYIQVDSLLNIAYNELTFNLNTVEKDDFKKEQLVWVVKRNEYFEQEKAILREKMAQGEWGKDMEMIFYDEQANFVMRRVEELLELSNTKK